MEPECSLPCSKEPVNSEALRNISLTSSFYGEKLLIPHSAPKLEDHHLSTVLNCLFNTSTATLQIWRLSAPSANPRTRHAVVILVSILKSLTIQHLCTETSIITFIFTDINLLFFMLGYSLLQ